LHLLLPETVLRLLRALEFTEINSNAIRCLLEALELVVGANGVLSKTGLDGVEEDLMELCTVDGVLWDRIPSFDTSRLLRDELSIVCVVPESRRVTVRTDLRGYFKTCSKKPSSSLASSTSHASSHLSSSVWMPFPSSGHASFSARPRSWSTFAPVCQELT